MIRRDRSRTPRDLLPAIDGMFELSAAKILSLDRSWSSSGAPVFTVAGKYTARGWTEWTEGFVYGAALLQFDATGDRAFLDLGRQRTLGRMAPHLTHVGVHDHGFNNVSTYGTLWRLAREGRFEADAWQVHFYELALKVSGAVQARRWTPLPSGGFIHSFNGAHSLFVDAIRSLRALALSHSLGHRLSGEQDAQVNLLERLLQHARATAQFSVYYGQGRDTYDVRGRVAHESLFNAANGTHRGPNSQQGYSPFTTWTRGLAWAMLGFPEQIEFLETLPDAAFTGESRAAVDAWMLGAARATCDFYIDRAAAADGVPYWDTGAPGLAALGGWADRAADPFNDVEPVDSSAAAIGAQGLLRLGNLLTRRGQDGDRYTQAGLQVLDTLLDKAGPYLSVSPDHQGLLLHSVYHRPNGWDHVPDGSKIPRGESSQWGDYHLREAALYVKRLATGAPYLTFFGPQFPRMPEPRTIAIVTGGARGIGLGISRALAQDGWDLAIGGVRPRADVEEVLASLRTHGGRVHYVQGDVGETASRTRLVSEVIETLGTPAALVNNAGRAPRVRADLIDATEESFEEVLRTNLQGPYFLAQAVAREMIARGSPPASRGGIVFITSVSAEMASPNRGEYCVSKAGLAMAAKLFAAHLAPHGIPVYEVRPGVIATDMTSGVKDKYDQRIADGLIPDARWGTPDDVGRAVAALLRGDVPYATGTVLHIDGGLTIPRL